MRLKLMILKSSELESILNRLVNFLLWKDNSVGAHFLCSNKLYKRRFSRQSQNCPYNFHLSRSRRHSPPQEMRSFSNFFLCSPVTIIDIVMYSSTTRSSEAATGVVL